MNVTFVLYHYDGSFRAPIEFYQYLHENLLNGIDPSIWGIERLNIVCRAGLNADQHYNNINIYLRHDKFPNVLGWHQRPDPVFDLLEKLNSDIIHAFSLGLPLHFRWLRRLLGPDVRLIAHHTGEPHWIQMKLWMQQFGLRVVNGFVFRHQEDAQPWLKAALILPEQTVISLENGHNTIKRDRVIPDMYEELTQCSSI